MTGSTVYLNLKTFDTPADNTQMVYAFVNTTSGSSSDTNISIIDRVLGETSASATDIYNTASLVVLTSTPKLKYSKILTGGSAIEITNTSTLVHIGAKSASPIYVTPQGKLGLAIHSTLSASSGSLALQNLGAAVVGNWNSVDVDSFGRVTAGYSVAGGLISELKFADSAVPTTPTTGCSVLYFDTSGSLHAFNTGSNINLTNILMNSAYQKFDRKGDLLIASGSKSGSILAIGADGLQLEADSTAAGGIKWGRQIKDCFIGLSQTTALNSTNMAYIVIPADMNGWKLSAVIATAGSSSSGSPAFTVKSGSNLKIGGSQTMLTTNPVVGEQTYTSNFGSLGSVAAVVNSAYSTVATGNSVWVGTTASTCGSGVNWAGVTLTFQNGT